MSANDLELALRLQDDFDREYRNAQSPENRNILNEVSVHTDMTVSTIQLFYGAFVTEKWPKTNKSSNHFL